MKTTPSLQRIVTALAERHGVDPQRTGTYLRLQLAGHGHLIVENIGAQRVSVTNYITVGHELLADPEVVLYMAYHPEGATRAEWVPLEITQLFGGWSLYAEPDSQGGLAVYNLVGQAELADQCERVLAHHLMHDGWLTGGERANLARPIWTPEEIEARDIRCDDVPF